MQRYLTAATREFQRQYRMLEHHYKTHKPTPAEEPPRQHIHVVGGRPASEKSPDPNVSGSAPSTATGRKQANVKIP